MNREGYEQLNDGESSASHEDLSRKRSTIEIRDSENLKAFLQNGNQIDKEVILNYSSYQNEPSAPPPHVSSESREIRRGEKNPDRTFSVIFWLVFSFSLLEFIRFIFLKPAQSKWIIDSTEPVWSLVLGVVEGNIFGWVWYFLILHRITFIRSWEKFWSTLCYTLTLISLAFSWAVYNDPDNVISGIRVAYIGEWVFRIWIILILRLVWDAIFTSEDDHRMTQEIIISVKEQLSRFTPYIFIVTFLESFWLVLWSICFSLASDIYVSDSIVVLFPTSQYFLMLALLWVLAVSRGSILSFVASSIAYWYSTEGKVPITQIRAEIFRDTFTSEFGSVVFGSTFVDSISLINWTLLRINRLIFNNKKSFLTTAVSNLEKFANTGAYGIITSEYKDFRSASESSSALRQGNKMKLFQGNTLQYHSIFVGLQAFVATLVGTANLVAAIISFYIAFTLTGALMISVVSVQTCVAKDPAFYQSHASEAYSFIEKIAPREIPVRVQEDEALLD